MRTAIFVILLAFAKCQQVCQLDSYTAYSDPECKVPKEEPKPLNEFVLKRFNEISAAGPFCQSVSPDGPGTGNGAMIRITCLTSEAAKIENFNMQREDPVCQYPYPSYADIPSYVAESGVCVRTTRDQWNIYKISSTTDTFEKTDNSWEIADYFKPNDTSEVYTDEWKKDNTPGADRCMLNGLDLYLDPDCTKLDPESEGKFKKVFINLGNEWIKEKECSYGDKQNKTGVKGRAYCEDEYTMTLKAYNSMNEDPFCLRSYPLEAIQPGYTAKDGDCVRFLHDKWARFQIGPNSNLQTDQKDISDFNDKKDDGGKQSGANGVSMSGDGYEVSIHQDKDKYGNDQITSETKFDQYFMYSIDNMGGNADEMPPCGPQVDYDKCKDLAGSQNTCCTHVVMRDEFNEYSFYRCMNQRVVDASFSVDIDGMKMSMGCTDGTSAAAYFTSAILSSIAALITMSIF